LDEINEKAKRIKKLIDPEFFAERFELNDNLTMII